MKHKRKLLSALFVLGLGLSGVQAQEAVLTSGGDASGSGGSASYSIGQVNYTTYESSDGSVAQGVQQAYEISVAVGIHEEGINLGLSTFPNPATDYLILEVEGYSSENLSYQLYDMNGRILESQDINGSQTTIEMINYVPAGYFLRVLKNDAEVKTFKIIKH